MFFWDSNTATPNSFISMPFISAKTRLTCENRPSGSHIHLNNNSAAESNRLDIRTQLLGEEHQTTADSSCKLGATQYALTDYTLAAESHERALNIRQKGWNKDHKRTVDSYHKLGLTQYRLSDYTSATESHKRALKIRQTVLGENHEKTAERNHWLGLPNMCLAITPQPLSHTSEHWTSDKRYCMWKT